MFHSRQLNNRINKIQERALRLVHKDNKLTFDDSLAPEIMTEVFEIKEPHYNFRSEASHIKRENVKSTHCNIQSV